VRERDRRRRWATERGGEGGEGLRGDGQHGNAMFWRSWTGVRCENGEDFGVGLEGDQDGFGGGDTAAAWGFFRLSRKREGDARREMTTSPACQTIVQTYFGSLEFLSAAAASYAQVSILADLVICTTCVDLNLRLHKS
jgi:hypothetical protein